MVDILDNVLLIACKVSVDIPEILEEPRLIITLETHLNKL